MISEVIALLVMLNPFALFIYLQPIMKDLNNKDFLKVLLKSSVISLGIFILFLLTGEFLFEKIFQINFESFRIFGGIVIFSFAYYFIVKGQKAMIHIKGSLDDLASEIALPFMVGAGTISITILMSQSLPMLGGLLSLVIVLAINFAIIAILNYSRGKITFKKFRIAFDKNMEILLRLNGFFVGAIGIDMILRGISNIF